jgi:hypothetical protein
MANFNKVVQYVPTKIGAQNLNIRMSLVDLASGIQITTPLTFNPTLASITYPFNDKKVGIRPRHLIIKLDSGTAPLIQTRRKRIVILTQADFDAFVVSTTFQLSYQGVLWAIEGFVREHLTS